LRLGAGRNQNDPEVLRSLRKSGQIQNGATGSFSLQCGANFRCGKPDLWNVMRAKQTGILGGQLEGGK
jgi:hypothetical protein